MSVPENLKRTGLGKVHGNLASRSRPSMKPSITTYQGNLAERIMHYNLHGGVDNGISGIIIPCQPPRGDYNALSFLLNQAPPGPAYGGGGDAVHGLRPCLIRVRRQVEGVTLCMAFGHA